MRPDTRRAVFVRFATNVQPGYGFHTTGARRYVEDPRFRILGSAVAIGVQSVRFFWDGAPRRGDSLDTARAMLCAQRDAGATLVAHDVHLVSLILRKSCDLTFDRMFDSAGYGAFLGIGRDLKYVAEWFGYSRPDTPPCDRGSLADPSTLRRLAGSCMHDLAFCREIFKAAVADPTYPDIEFNVQNQTAQVNLRGIQIGASQLATWARVLRDRRDAELDAFTRMFRFDTSRLASTNEVAAFVRKRFGVTIRTFDRGKADFAGASAQGGDLGEFLVRRARLLALSRVLRRAADYAQIREGRVHGILRYYGAHTGRFSAGGRDCEKFNIHGLGRGSDGSDVLGLPELAGERTLLVPPEGHVFLAADLSNIEARVVSWLAGETELVRRFARTRTSTHGSRG